MDPCKDETVEHSSVPFTQQEHGFPMKPATPSVIRRGICKLKNEGKSELIKKTLFDKPVNRRKYKDKA